MAIKMSINNAKRLGVATVRGYDGKQQIKNVLNGKILITKKSKGVKNDDGM